MTKTAGTGQYINWYQYAQIAYVNFGWSPDQFWQSTPPDFWCAYRGFRKSQGKSGAEYALDRGELNQLVLQDMKP